jgi:hypothetical protein
MKGKRDVKLKFTGRALTPAEADLIRTKVIEMRPRMHLVKADWPWIEVRGLPETKANQLTEALSALGLRFRGVSN